MISVSKVCYFIKAWFPPPSPFPLPPSPFPLPPLCQDMWLAFSFCSKCCFPVKISQKIYKTSFDSYFPNYLLESLLKAVY